MDFVAGRSDDREVREQVNRAPRTIPRDRLLNRLQQAASYPIVLIIAPAGFGKSTAVQQMLQGDNRCIRMAVPASSSLEAFIGVFARCCAKLIPEMGTPPREAIPDTSVPDGLVDLYAAWAITNLHAVSCVIFVDDIQNADGDRAIVLFLTKVVDALKSRVQWILASRTRSSLPITRWQAYADADAPLTADDLRMTADDAIELARLLGCPATPAQLEAWVEQTRGFPVPLAYAIRLASRRKTTDGIMDGARSLTFQYLADQLWSSLDTVQRTILEIAAFLPPMHVHAYEGCGVANAPSFINLLCNDIAFLAVDGEGRFVMHDLFRDFIKQSLQMSDPSKRELRLAAAVHASQLWGDNNTALSLTIDAKMIDLAIEVIETISVSELDFSVKRRLVNFTLKLPASTLGLELLCLHAEHWSWFGEHQNAVYFANELLERQAAESRHLFCAIRAISRIANFQSDEQHRSWLARLPTLIPKLNSTDRLLAEAYQSLFVAQRSEDAPAAVELIKRIQENMQFLDLAGRVDASIAIGAALYHLGDNPAALQVNREAVATATLLADQRDLARSLNNFGLLLLSVFDSEVEAVFEPLRDAVERTGSWRFSHVSHWLQANYYAQKGDLCAALAALTLQPAVAPHEESQRSRLRFLRRHASNLCKLNSGAFGEVVDDFTKSALPKEPDSQYELVVDLAAARVFEGSLGLGIEVLRRAKAIRESLTPFQFGAVRSAVVIEIIALGVIGRWPEARRLFERIKGTAPNLASLDVALGLLCDGPPFVGVAEALGPCRGRPFMGLAALLIDRLLERAPVSEGAPRLTLAELEVLRLLGLGKPNKEIAAARSRSLDTVKRQVASIYHKLGVENRTAAVAVARTRGLL